MPYKPTGKPRGRPPKDKVASQEAKAAKERIIGATLRNAPHMGRVFAGLTDEQIDAMPAHELMRRLARVAIRAKDDRMLLTVAQTLLPYELARKTDASLTPEEIRHAIDVARSETARRGYDLTNVARLPDRVGERGDASVTGTNG